jgi:phosphatidylcholine synthase
MPLPNTHFYRLRAWLVHLYTSLGLITGFFTLAALFSGDARAFFIFQGISMFIDATDGFFARRWKVKVWAPELDGRKLDDITDYLNYTFLPIAFAFRFGMVTGPWTAVLAVVLITSIYGFCQNVAKTSDGYFTGFPNFWNILIFYLYFFGFSVPVNSLILFIFAALIFVPVKYLSYSSPILRGITYAVSLLYGLVLVAILFNFNNVDMRLVWVSLIAPLYYAIASLYLHLTGQSI